MNNRQKKTAPETAISETESNRIVTINSIIKNSANVKILILEPGEIPKPIRAADIPPEFLSRKLRCETLGTRFSLVSDAKSHEPMNISYAADIYRGTVLIVNRGLHKLRPMSADDLNAAFVWLMNHKV